MSTIEVRVPDIGDFKDVPVIEVFVKTGDTVAADDSLVTLESDKATMDVPAPSAGVVRDLKLKVGDKVSEGNVILTLESQSAGAAKPASAPLAAAPAPAAQASASYSWRRDSPAKIGAMKNPNTDATNIRRISATASFGAASDGSTPRPV